MQRLKRFFFRLALTLVVIYGLICLLVYAFQEKLIFFPKTLPKDYAFQFKTPYREFNIRSSSGNLINTLYFPADSAKGLIVYFHGNAGCLESWADVHEDFVFRGYDFLICDYAEYGKSQGRLSEANLFADAQAVYDSAKTIMPEERIILYGRSLGTGIAAHLAAVNRPGRLVLESPYYSMKDVSNHLYPYLPSFLLRYPLRTDEIFNRIKCPVTILHGTEDEVVYFESSLMLKALFKPGDRLYSIRGGHHNDLKSFEAYKNYLSEIFP